MTPDEARAQLAAETDRVERQRPFDTRIHPLATDDDLALSQFRVQYESARERDDTPDEFPSLTK